MNLRRMSFLLIPVFFAFAFTASAHRGGHKRPGYLPPYGPHGGKYSRLHGYYAEVVVKNGQARVYILERDVKNVAEKIKRVSLRIQFPGKAMRLAKLRYAKSDMSFRTKVSVSRRTRVVYFYVSALIHGRWRSVRIVYEPRG